MTKQIWDAWLQELEEDVIQDEFGYVPGEFTVYPDHWRPLFDEGCTPKQAFQRALDGFSATRDEEEAARQRNWQRIQAEDNVAIAQKHR